MSKVYQTIGSLKQVKAGIDPTPKHQSLITIQKSFVMAKHLRKRFWRFPFRIWVPIQTHQNLSFFPKITLRNASLECQIALLKLDVYFRRLRFALKFAQKTAMQIANHIHILLFFSQFSLL